MGKPKAVPLACLVAADAAKIEPSCSLECKYLTSSDYRDLLWTTLAEFPGDMHPLGAFSCSSCVTVAVELRVVFLPFLRYCTQHQHPDWTRTF